jgi:F-type H+-transporting ATPase subunit alpha
MARIRKAELSPSLEQVGEVERIGDGIATVAGLPDAVMDELLRFDDGTLGYVTELAPDRVSCVLLDEGLAISSGSRVVRTGEIVAVPVGPDLLGRVVDPLGRPLDGKGPIDAERHDPIERDAPTIGERELVTRPLQTGQTVIDAMFALGRGQRELIVGDRATGKTAVALDAIIAQRTSDVISVYIAIGQKSSTVRRVIQAAQRYGAADRCIFVIAEADTPPGRQWVAPYAGFTMAEYFRDLGSDVLVVIDDLTKHAAVHRQIALLLEQPPGREAYPGDVFYIHARLLERAANLAAEGGGGSLTALPIAETQAGNLAGYIPTNLISITDGQIYLDPKLFNANHKPAVDVGRSVSRVGGKTQAPALRALAESLRLDYAQFEELEVFSRFGAIVDPRTQQAIRRGQRIRQVLTQPEHRTLSLAEEVALLLALTEGLFDALELEAVDRFKEGLAACLQSRAVDVAATINETGELDDDGRGHLLSAVRDLVTSLAGDDPAP